MQFSKTLQRVLLTARSVERLSQLNDLTVRERVLPQYFFSAAGEMREHHYVTSGLQICAHYSGGRKKLLSNAFLVEK